MAGAELDELVKRIAGQIMDDLAPIVTEGDAYDTAHNIADLLIKDGYSKPHAATMEPNQ